jgi:hypothetical protein
MAVATKGQGVTFAVDRVKPATTRAIRSHGDAEEYTDRDDALFKQRKS